ncbi:MAG TPA: hypothetical protein VEB22_14920 [Phycisphaerales bacterium]|nr:hypothetical protein [Phycisphaerales bacterium]
MENHGRYPRHRPGWRLVFCMTVKHYISGKLMRRKDGKPFAFWVRARS